MLSGFGGAEIYHEHQKQEVVWVGRIIDANMRARTAGKEKLLVAGDFS